MQADLDPPVLKSGRRLIKHGLDLVFVNPLRTVLAHKQHPVPVFGTHEMSQDSHLAFLHINPRTNGFQRAPAGEQGLGIAEKGKVGTFAGEWLSQAPGMIQAIASEAR
jgi:hypothetical protein